MSMLPLLPEVPAHALIAYRNGKPVSKLDFLSHVLHLSRNLPSAGQVLNLCADRYWFAVGFFAAVHRGLLSVLPNSTAPESLSTVCAEYSDLVCLGDQAECPFPNLPYVRATAVETSSKIVEATAPLVARAKTVACVFTSGSTGKPQPHFKSFGGLWQSVQAEAQMLWAVTGGPCSVLGTVPFRHMYGLESSVLLPILGTGQMCSRVPFYPADVVTALSEIAAPRLLVTTPFQLRKLLEADVKLPSLAAVLSATAPLSDELATRTEREYATTVMEIYGSTETGQMATRKPTENKRWRVFPGISLTQSNGHTTASGGHLNGPQVLNDTVELSSATEFTLVDRNSNIVNVVGKRTSLEFLTHVISNVPGVLDAAFCMPEHDGESDVTRLAAFVVAPGLTSASILAALRAHIDPVFLPRPIIFLDVLPRDGNGKISASSIKALLTAHLPSKSRYGSTDDSVQR